MKPEVIFCPNCGSAEIQEIDLNIADGETLYQCDDCLNNFSVSFNPHTYEDYDEDC